MNIKATNNLTSKEYLSSLSPSFFKWLQECLLCFELSTFEEILASSEYFQKLVSLLAITSEMNDLMELIGFEETRVIIKEIFKGFDEMFNVSALARLILETPPNNIG
jgi:hypothetical protein